MNLGYFGKVLWVDLTNETFEEEELPEKIYRQYLGGFGLGCRLIYERQPPNVDPLGPESIFGFFPGLLTGTAAPFSGRYMVCGKSPQTGTWGDANSGGSFGPEIKKCGYDGILFKGMSNTPKYVALIDGKQEILDASDIWGLDIVEAEEKLKINHGKFIKTAGIGKAGEKLSLFAGIANDKGRIAARSGIGAVMGSKKLKLLALKGKNKINFKDKQTFMNFVKSYNKKGSSEEPRKITRKILNMIPNMAKTMRRFNVGMAGTSGIMRSIYHNMGTCVGNTLLPEIGDGPVKNWGGIGIVDFPFNKSKYISASRINSYKVKNYGCYSCPVQCGAILKVPEINLEETHLPEYETGAAFGSLILNNDLLTLFEMNHLCNLEASDTISMGGTIAFAIECFKNGILTNEDTDGLDLEWGNSKAILELCKKIIKREGIGDILADGCKKAAEKIGKNSEKYAMHSLGSELPMHNPRFTNSLAFSYAYDPTPGKHNTASVDMADIGPINKFVKGFALPKNWKKDEIRRLEAQTLITGLYQPLNCVGLCIFSTLFGQYPLLELINSLTGWELNLDEVLKTGFRIQTLRQAFTLREGIEIAYNELPGRITGNPPDEVGPMKGRTIKYKEFYKNHCREMGWNPENGYPLEETLKDLDLEFVIKDLY